MINQAQANAIQSKLSNYTCPICGGKHFTIFPEKQQFIWNNNGAATNTTNSNALRAIVAICDECQHILAFRTED